MIKTVVIYLLLIVVINITLFNLDESISIRFIDVGQGDSILIKTQRGEIFL